MSATKPNLLTARPNCSRRLRSEGKPYPRRCVVCGLLGPCQDGELPTPALDAAWSGEVPQMPSSPAPDVFLFGGPA